MSKKRNFTLKNIDINNVNSKYGLAMISNIEKENKEEKLNTTNITDVISIESEHRISFLDENKRDQKCIVTMVEWLNMKSLPEKTNLHCYWCKNNFASRPIGCPIKFVNSSIEKSYTSQITKDKYYMKENVTKTKLKSILSKPFQGIDIVPIENDHYLTDGVFCSFNCVVAFIKDNNNDIFYRESYSLIHSMYEEFSGKKISKIFPAPHWRLLKDYGGHLSIDEFRQTFNTIEHEFMFNIRDMKTLSKVYKEKYI